MRCSAGPWRRASSDGGTATPRRAGTCRRAPDAGFELLAEPDHQLAPLTAIRVPDGVDGKAVQRQLLQQDGIEVGGGLGPEAPAIWRVGLMGPNANIETADRVLDALLAAVESQNAAVPG